MGDSITSDGDAIKTFHNAKLSKIKIPPDVDLSAEFLGFDYHFGAEETAVIPFALIQPESERHKLYATDDSDEGLKLLMTFDESKAVVNPAAFMEGKAFFQVDSFYSNDKTLWVTDGTPEGTKFIRTFNDTIDTKEFTIFKDQLYFFVGEEQLWRTDGTEEGTTMVQQFPADSGILRDMMAPTNSGYIMFTRGRYPKYTLFASDGRAKWSRILAQDLQNPRIHFLPLTSDGKQLFYTTDGLWSTKGTVDTTSMYLSLNNTFGLARSRFQSDDRAFGVLAGTTPGVYFLFVTDGTAEGTKPINITDENMKGIAYYDFEEETENSGYSTLSAFIGNSDITTDATIPRFSVAAFWDRVNDRFAFLHMQWSDRYGEKVLVTLYGSDGTSTGTELIKSFEYSGRRGSSILADGRLLLKNDFDVWISDGTDDGTKVLVEFDPSQFDAESQIISRLSVNQFQDGSVLLDVIRNTTSGPQSELWRMELEGFNKSLDQAGSMANNPVDLTCLLFFLMITWLFIVH